MKWQEAALILTALLVVGGAVTYTNLFGVLFQLSGVAYTNSGDIVCGTECESYINVTTSYWKICFSHYGDNDVLFRDAVANTLYVNLNKVNNIISTNPPVPVDWYVKSSDEFVPIYDGYCWERRQNNEMKLMGHKNKADTVKWSFAVDEYVDIDPTWEGEEDEDKIVTKEFLSLKLSDKEYIELMTSGKLYNQDFTKEAKTGTGDKKLLTSDYVNLTQNKDYKEIINFTAYNFKSADDMIKKAEDRGLAVKHDYQLLYLLDFYPKKIAKIKQLISESKDEKYINMTKQELSNLEDKYLAVLLEIKIRETNTALRKPVGTVYYMDLTSGDNSNDGLAPGTSWKTLAKYTTTTARSPGDILYIRGGTTETMGYYCQFDEDGTAINPIEIIGCNGISCDYWGDGATQIPKFILNAGELILNGDDYWEFNYMNITASTDYNGNLYLYNSNVYFNNVDSYNSQVNTEGYNVLQNAKVEIKNSIISVGNAHAIDNVLSYLKISNSSISSTTIETIYGYTSSYDLENVIMQAGNSYGCLVNSHGNMNINGFSCSQPLLFQQYYTYLFPSTISYSYGDFNENNTGFYTLRGHVYKNSTVTQYGIPYVIQMASNNNCGTNQPLEMVYSPNEGLAFYVNDTTARTVKLTVKTIGWASVPSANDLYLQVEDKGNNGKPNYYKSTQTIAGNDIWTNLSVSFTPRQAGLVYATILLGAYETTGIIQISPKLFIE